MTSKLINFLESQSYKSDFTDFMRRMEDKYGSAILEECGIGSQLDISKMSKDFFKTKATADVSVDANANVADTSVISHKIEMAKPFQLINSYYRIYKEIKKSRGVEYAEKILESQISGRIYINDFHAASSGMAYCFNYSTFDTALMGIPGKFDGRGGSKPPKNLMSFLGQIELFSLIAGNSTLGATGLADLLIVMSIFVKKILVTGEDAHVEYKVREEDIDTFVLATINDLRNTGDFSDKQLEVVEYILRAKQKWAHFDLSNEKNCWQYVESLLTGFIYRLNQPYRGSQSLFSNVSVFDKYFLEGLLPSYSLEIEGEVYSAEMEIVQKMQDVYIDIMNRELARKPITFPVTTACFSIDEDKNILDKDFLKYISEKNLKFGFINMYSGKSSTLSSCCRLRSEQDNEYFNSFGSGSTKIGSLSVSTGNLPQLAFKLKDEENARELFLEKVKELVIDCQEANNAKRNLIKKAIKAGAQPLYSLGYMDIKRQYSTFGVVGLYEALQILGLDIKSQEGKDYALKMMDIINETNKELQSRFKAPHNCEQIPAENVAVKLAKKDKILGYNNEYPLYSNQFIPLIERTNMLDRIELQGTFDSKFSGGAICHLNMDQEIKDAKVMSDLIEICAKKGVVYFAINYVLQECEDGHMSVGNVDICPICGKPIVGKYTRVVGFLTKVNNWNKTRREADFPNRQFYGSINV